MFTVDDVFLKTFRSKKEALSFCQEKRLEEVLRFCGRIFGKCFVLRNALDGLEFVLNMFWASGGI